MKINKTIPINHTGLYLHFLEESDLYFTLSSRNHHSNRFWFLTTDKITLSQHQSWFYNYKKLESEYKDFVFVIKDSDSIRYGQISLYKIDHHKESASIGRLFIAPNHKGKGIMNHAFPACIQIAKNIGIKKLILEVHKNNKAALNLFTKFNFHEIGIFNSEFIKMESLI